MAQETATLAGYVAALNYDDIPPEVLERAKVLTLDFLGSAIRARREAESTPAVAQHAGGVEAGRRGRSHRVR
jgi:2-methylcitrate dehydratase PrpD